MYKEFIVILVVFVFIFAIAMLIPSKYIHCGTKNHKVMQGRKREMYRLIKNKRK